MLATGAYDCPLRHGEPNVPLRGENARIDSQGLLTLDKPLPGTRPARRLVWQRYPRSDGWIDPWTSSGTLRPGLRFDRTSNGGWGCSDGSEMSPAKDGGRCVLRGFYRYDPCFLPPGFRGRSGSVAACGELPGATNFIRFVIGPPTDSPHLEPWNGIGAIWLGVSRSDVVRAYGRADSYRGYYRLHGSRVYVEFENGLVNRVDFSTPFYRTEDGFGVGSRIPLGPCHRKATSACEHRWRGFVWNAWVRERPCSCWVKVGDGAESLPVTAANFLKHWVFLYVRGGRVTRIVMVQRFVD